MQVTTCSFAGIEKCLKVTEGNIELIVTLSFGPRIISCSLPGKKNFFRVFEEDVANARAPGWHNFGGHRLWHAPESFPRTYFEDNGEVEYRQEGNTLIFRPALDEGSKLQSEMAITMAEGKVKLRHTIENKGYWPVELSVWDVSVMAPGSALILPQEEFVPHGHGPGESLLPCRPVVLWGYSNMSDCRYTWGTKSIQMREFGGAPGCKNIKFGALNTRGFIAVINDGNTFVTYYRGDKNAKYPDMGCNCEFYTTPGMLEVEVLGPLTVIEPGGSATNTDEWELFEGIPAFVKELL